jgi:hypothetical protein
MPIASRAAADRSTAYLWPSMTTVFVQWILIHRLPSSDRNMRVRERRKSRIVSGEKLICLVHSHLTKLSMEEVTGILVR